MKRYTDDVEDMIIFGRDADFESMEALAFYPSSAVNPWLVALRDSAAVASADFRRENSVCAEHDKIVVEKIAVVGALFKNDQINIDDLRMIEDALISCEKHGIDVAPSFDLTLLNLNKNKRGGFLDYDGRADLVVVCCVYDGDSRLFPFDPELRQDQRHHEVGVWHDQSLRVGARAIVTYDYGGREVRADRFAPAKGQKAAYAVIEDGEAGETLSTQYRTVMVRRGARAAEPGPK